MRPFSGLERRPLSGQPTLEFVGVHGQNITFLLCLSNASGWWQGEHPLHFRFFHPSSGPRGPPGPMPAHRCLEVPRPLFASFQRLPFIETRGGDDTAAVRQRFPKVGLLGCRFDPCVEGAVAGLRFLGPMGDQPLAHRGSFGAISGIPDHRNGLAGPNIVVRREVGQGQGQQTHQPVQLRGSTA